MATGAGLGPGGMAAWDRLPPDVRALVRDRLSAEEQVRLAVTSRTAWAEDAMFRLVRQLVRRHRMLDQAGPFGLPVVRAFAEPQITDQPRPSDQTVLAMAGLARLDDDGQVWWRLSSRLRLPVPLGGRRAVALSGGQSFVAVLCQGGDLLLWRPGMTEAELVLREVVRVAGDHMTVYALTRSFSVLAWQAAGPTERMLLGVGVGGPYRTPTIAGLDWVHGYAGQLAVATNGMGHVASVYAVDRTGLAVWGCGSETMRNSTLMHVALTPLPSPPVPIRHLLALGVGLHCRIVPEDGGDEPRQGRVVQIPGGNGLGPLALLEDGTVWSPILAERLPLQRNWNHVEGPTLAMARDAANPTQVRLLTAAGKHLTARLSHLALVSTVQYWLEVQL